jgi:hypothetical protein
VTRRTTLAAIAAAGLVGVLLRLHFLSVPLNTDEGGFAAIARLWRQGYEIYGDVAWVDRPQGLLVLFRLAGLSGSSEALRVMAIVAAVVTLVAVAAAAWAVAGRGPAVAAASLYAVLSPAPHLEGFTANGELLSGAFAAAGVACALWWTIRRDWWLLAAAALLAGSAPLVKQSAIDGIVVVGAAALLIADRRWRNVAIAVVAGAIPGLIAVVHAATATAGLSDWWYAIVGYRSETESVVSGDIGSRFRLLVDSVPPAFQDLLPILVLALLGLRRGRPGPALLAIWLAAGIVGFLGGGLYHPHYWIQLVPVLSVLAGIGLVRLLHLPLAVKLAFALTLVPVVAYSAEVYSTTSPTRISALTSDDSRLATAPAVGRLLASETRPGEPVYVIWANAAVYWYANRPPAFRYLWYLNVQRIPGATEDVTAILTGPSPPRVVAVYQDPDGIDKTGAVSRTLAERYTLVRRIGDVPVYRLRPT